MNISKRPPHVIVIGAGIGGLSAALELAASGCRVTVLERHAAAGGKLRQVKVGGLGIDSGPTVFTMRWIFEELFARAGRLLDEQLTLLPAEILARHSWPDRSRLDLFADLDRTAAAIEAFAGHREAGAYRRFAAASRSMFETLDHSFMRVERPTPAGLTLSLGACGIAGLFATKPFTTLWKELGRIFRDPRLRQLFGRYATYCGSSPLDAPATLMLIAHAERAGVWLVEGGMIRLAEALAETARACGAGFRYSAHVARIRTAHGSACGVELASGEVLDADAVVFNGDVAALGDGLLGDELRTAVVARRDEPRSLSAITWSLLARPEGFPLAHHTVFFGPDYRDEFDALFGRREITAEPTVYVCAQDRGNGGAGRTGAERLFLLVNAPPRALADAEIRACEERVFELLQRHGLSLGNPVGAPAVTAPQDFDRLFPGSAGAIYGWPTHGAMGSFRRHGSRSAIPGLYLAGGSVHPGPGVPMTAISGRLAARSVRRDLGLA